MFTTAVADTSCLSSKTQTKKMHFGNIVFLIRDLRFTLQVVCIPLCSPIYVFSTPNYSLSNVLLI